MKFPHFFIQRPIFATVLSIIIVLVGGITYFSLASFAVPQRRAADHRGPHQLSRSATPDVISKTVATPIEQEMNGVDDMLYMESSSSADGTMQLTVTFKLGTDLDNAQVLVQNRVAVAEPTIAGRGTPSRCDYVNKLIPDMLMVVHLNSPDKSRDGLYISNYAYLASTRCLDAARRRGRNPDRGWQRICDASLAGHRKDDARRPDCRRHRRRGPRAKRSSGVGRDRTASD